jgi:hypothetical protein
MILTGGFLNKSAGYYYYVQNIKLNKTGWESVVVKHDDNIIATFKNNNTEMNFELKQDNSYNVVLMINDNYIFQSRQLFKFDLDVTLTDNSNENVYEFKEGLIVDH